MADTQADTRRRKKLNLERDLDRWFPISMYAGAAAVALGFARLPETTWLWRGGTTGPRAWILLWLPVLLGIDLLLDRTYRNCLRKDLAERERKVKNGGLHVRTLEALASPGMLLLDAAAILYVSLSASRSGTEADVTAMRLRTIAMAAGIVLWIYGRMLPRVPYGSIWGIRTKSSLRDVPSWGRAQLRAVPFACLGGAGALLAGAFLPAVAAAATAGGLFCLAFIAMFRPLPEK